MGLIDCASGSSLWRGYDYFKKNHVTEFEWIDDQTLHARVIGSESQLYEVTVNCKHPRSSTCSCPHASGKRIVCKQMVAVFFYAFPDVAEDLYNRAVEELDREEETQQKVEKQLIEYVSKMKKADLQETLLRLLFDGPEWQYNKP